VIRGYESKPPEQIPAEIGFQWGPAFGAGLIAGVLLLFVPHGSPWERFSFFSHAVMGRSLGFQGILLPVTWVLHLGISVIYGLIVSRIVANITVYRAFLVGGAVGVILYVLNYIVVSNWLPEFSGSEFSVLVTHFVFGLVCAGAYRGLLRRKILVVSHP